MITDDYYKCIESVKTGITRKDYGMELTQRLKRAGDNPYTYISDALKLLINGDYDTSLQILEYASLFQGIFYAEGSAQDDDLVHSIQLFRDILKNNPDEFRKLMIRVREFN